MKTLQKIEILSAFTFAFLCGMPGVVFLILILAGPFSWFLFSISACLIILAVMLLHDGIKAVRELKEK